jgi:hydroxymethylpyrimidine/phosphomethylpyrimidine kinase
MNIRDAVFSAKAGVFESISSRYSVGKGIDVVNPMGSIERESMRYVVMTRLREAIREIESLLSPRWVPEVGINFAYALPMATGMEHVCGLEGRITSIGGSISHCGGVDFGASKHVARVVLTAMQFDPEMRSAINLRFSEENLTSLKSADMSLGSFGREKEPKNKMTMEWGTRKAIETLGFVPDAIFDGGSVGKEPMIRLLGRNPNEILTKLRRVLN